jgi:hypothetical protein
MKYTPLSTLTLGLFIGCLPGPDQVHRKDVVPLYDNLGTHHYEVSGRVPLTQSYFDQGLQFHYAYNHAEAVRSFIEASRLHPTCAMGS